jgi:hypothetical protein
LNGAPRANVLDWHQENAPLGKQRGTDALDPFLPEHFQLVQKEPLLMTPHHCDKANTARLLQAVAGRGWDIGRDDLELNAA